MFRRGIIKSRFEDPEINEWKRCRRKTLLPNVSKAAPDTFFCKMEIFFLSDHFPNFPFFRINTRWVVQSERLPNVSKVTLFQFGRLFLPKMDFRPPFRTPSPSIFGFTESTSSVSKSGGKRTTVAECVVRSNADNSIQPLVPSKWKRKSGLPLFHPRQRASLERPPLSGLFRNFLIAMIFAWARARFSKKNRNCGFRSWRHSDFRLVQTRRDARTTCEKRGSTLCYARAGKRHQAARACARVRLLSLLPRASSAARDVSSKHLPPVLPRS